MLTQVDKKYVDLLLKFLEEKGIAELFSSRIMIRGIMDISHFSELFANAFPWATSEEGFDFWNNLDDEWINYLNLNA